MSTAKYRTHYSPHTKDYRPLPPADEYSPTEEYLASLDSDVRDEHEAVHSVDQGQGSPESPDPINASVEMKHLRKVCVCARARACVRVSITSSPTHTGVH